MSLLLILSSCAGDGSLPEVRDTSGDACGEVKVPLPLASKVMQDREGGSIHIWRVGLKCRIREVNFKEGTQVKIEQLHVQLVVKGFVENTFQPYDLSVPIVIVVKDEIGNRVMARRTGSVALQIAEDGGTAERIYDYVLKLEEQDEDFRKRVYPTVFVGIQLLPKEWMRYKDLLDQVGERALLPGGY